MYTYTEAKGCWDGSSCWLLSVLCSSCLTRSTDRFNVSHVLVKTPVAETPWTQQRRHVSGLSSFSVANFHPSIYRQTSLLQHSGAGVNPGVDVGSTQTPSREIQGWESNPQPPCWTGWTASLFPEETHETLSSGVEAEHSCHSFASTNPNLTIKPWCAEAATLLGPGKASSVTWLHKSAPNQTTQQEKLLEHSSPGVGTRFRPGGWKPWKAETDRGGFNHPLCFLHLQNFSLSWRLFASLPNVLSRRVSFSTFSFSCFDVRQEKHLRDSKCFNCELLVHLHGKNIKSLLSWLSTAATEKLSAVNVCGSWYRKKKKKTNTQKNNTFMARCFSAPGEDEDLTSLSHQQTVFGVTCRHFDSGSNISNNLLLSCHEFSFKLFNPNWF